MRYAKPFGSNGISKPPPPPPPPAAEVKPLAVAVGPRESGSDDPLAPVAAVRDVVAGCDGRGVGTDRSSLASDASSPPPSSSARCAFDFVAVLRVGRCRAFAAAVAAGAAAVDLFERTVGSGFTFGGLGVGGEAPPPPLTASDLLIRGLEAGVSGEVERARAGCERVENDAGVGSSRMDAGTCDSKYRTRSISSRIRSSARLRIVGFCACPQSHNSANSLKRRFNPNRRRISASLCFFRLIAFASLSSPNSLAPPALPPPLLLHQQSICNTERQNEPK